MQKNKEWNCFCTPFTKHRNHGIDREKNTEMERERGKS